MRIDSPGDALAVLAEMLRGEASVISALVEQPPHPRATLGSLAAAGPRTAAAPLEYALMLESVREGYLLHYGEPRILAGADHDLGLLAGDYLYALGLERLAALADLDAVRELSDLISLAAALHGGEREAARAEREAQALWLAVATAIACGADERYAAAISALRSGSGDAATLLREAAESAARAGECSERLSEAAFAIESTANTPT